MRFVVLGASEFALRCAGAIIDSRAEVRALISTPPHARPNNSTDVSAFASERRIPYYEMEDVNVPDSANLIRELSPDYILSAWHKILKREILGIPRFGCIGTHPTELPFNRGRHPLHWLIALGISNTTLTFFRMDEGVDSGNVLLQIPFQIAPDDCIDDAVSAMNEAAYEGTKSLCARLLRDPDYAGTKQDHTVANSWRKRTPHDVTIDLRMSADIIRRTIQSFAPPYPCANLLFEGHMIKVSRASIAALTTELAPDQLRRLEPGRVIAVAGNTVRVKVDDAIMDLECRGPLPSRVFEAKYIHPPSKYLAEWPRVLAA
ncbi:MAG: methionyl-tRNA formyltransferase [Candidatus Omnitrophica bacterium]|nr:methionyl-tRNA formyltransferase [Candidatus Omnitrophota bacterium]